MTTDDGAVLVGPTEITGMQVTGTVTDNRRVRGVMLFAVGSRDAVVVGSGFMEFQETSLQCGANRRSCTWTASVPFESGDWTLWVVATDGAGNTRRSSKIDVKVVTVPYLPAI